MATRNASHEHKLPPRPPLTSHQSNSVPSTPHQYAKEFRSRSRSPSPHHGLSLGSHSPRSVKSEANGPLASLPKGRPTCKYETVASFSRRRMQYDIGDAPLDKPKEEPKKFLNPDEESKLSGDMRELYDRLLPSEESDSRRVKFVDKLQRILQRQWPEAEFTVHIFGSSGNLLCTSESDVDICIQTPMKKLESMHQLAEVLANNGMERVTCIAAAKVPIVKIWDPELKLAADMNVNNTLALENTRMIKTYVQIDERVRPLAMIVKHWTKQRILNDAGIGGTLSSYAWICMILNFLQTRNPPILPALHQMPHKEYMAQDGTESGFNDDIEKLRDFGSANKETIGELLFHFFRLYSFELQYDASVISVRHGKLLTRQEKGWDHAKEGQWRLAIEEPFNTTRNLGNSADSTAFRGIHLELRQAFDHLANGLDLEKMVDAYEFPPAEKDLFQKPKTGPRPVLSAAIAPMPPPNRTPRGGGSMRGGRHNNSSRQGSGYRRSSSGASFGRHPFPPFLNSPPIGGGIDYLNINVPTTPEGRQQLQDQLLHLSQVNGLQLEQLKAKFALGQQQIRAAEQARNASLVHAHTVAQGSSKSSQGNSSTVSPQKTPFVTGNSSPSLSHSSLYHDYHPYQLLGYEGSPLMQSQSHEGARTNPSSPSLSNAIPRRTQQRTSERLLNGSAQGTSGLRSQSQPARTFSQGFALPGYPQFANIPGYGVGVPSYSISSIGSGEHPSTMSQTSEASTANTGWENSSLYRASSLSSSTQPDVAMQTQTPKEYVGYYLPGQPLMSATTPAPPPQNAPLPVFGTLQQIPAYSDLAHRRNRMSEGRDMANALTLNGSRQSHASRSPSPLGGPPSHQRTFSIPASHAGMAGMGLKSAPLPASVSATGKSSHLLQRPDHIELPARPRPSASGPMVLNGSTALPTTPEHQFTASDEDASTAASGGEDSRSVASFFSRTATMGQEDAVGLGMNLGMMGGVADGLQPQPQPQHSGFNARGSPSGEGLAPRPGKSLTSYSPPQSFPQFVDPTSTFQPGFAQALENQMSPKSTSTQSQSAWSTIANASVNGSGSSNNKPNIPHLDTVKAAQLQGKPSEAGAKTAPVLLSPVYETRTPSPTAIRGGRGDHFRQTSINGILAPVNGGVNGRPAEPVPPTPFDPHKGNAVEQKSMPGNASAPSQWQTIPQTSGARRKNRRRSKSGPQAGKRDLPGHSPNLGNGSDSKSPNVGGKSPSVGSSSNAKPAIETERKGG